MNPCIGRFLKTLDIKNVIFESVSEINKFKTTPIKLMQDNSHSICQIFASRLGALASLYVYSTYDLLHCMIVEADNTILGGPAYIHHLALRKILVNVDFSGQLAIKHTMCPGSSYSILYSKLLYKMV